MRRYLDLILVSVFILPVLSLCCSGGSPLDPTQDFALTNIVGSEVLSSPPVYAYDVQVAVSPLTGEIYCCWVHKEGGVPEVFWRHGRLGLWRFCLGRLHGLTGRGRRRPDRPDVLLSAHQAIAGARRHHDRGPQRDGNKRGARAPAPTTNSENS